MIKAQASSDASLTEEEKERKIDSMLEEYCMAIDLKEATTCVEELHDPDYGARVVSKTVEKIIDSMKDKEVEVLSNLILGFVEKDVVTLDQVMEGLRVHTDMLEDLALDAPKAPGRLGDLFGAGVVAEVFSLADLPDLCGPTEDALTRRDFVSSALLAIQSKATKSTKDKVVEKKKGRKDKETDLERERKRKEEKEKKKKDEDKRRKEEEKKKSTKKTIPKMEKVLKENKGSGYLEGFDLPPSSDEDEDTEREKRGGKQEEGTLVVQHTQKEDRKKLQKERMQAMKMAEAKREAVKDDDNVFDVSFETSQLQESEAAAHSRDVRVEKLTMRAKGKILLDNASLSIVNGRRYGLVGPNGKGKSTLLRMIARRQIPVPDYIDVLLVEQEVVGDDCTALEAVVAADVELMNLREEEKELNEKLGSLTLDGREGAATAAEENADEEANQRLNEIYERMQELGSSTAEARASKILHGLGFTEAMQRRPTKSFSGGWRMRISLARALYIKPTLLLLDEPTNHLDLRAVLWLEEYLNRWKKTLVVVSHDREFLNSITTDIIHLHDETLTNYRGNFVQFEEMYEQKRREVNKAFERYEKQMKAAKASGSKVKQNKVQEKAKQQQKDKLIDAGFMYPGREDFRMSNLNLGVDMGSRVAIVGPNGAVSYLLEKFPQEATKPEQMRAILGKFGLAGHNHLQPILKLSGGQKARVVFAAISLSNPHILLLDEPTNHLDMQSIDALADALEEYTGGVIIVSHDARLLSRVCDDEERAEVWIVDNGTVTRYNGDFEDYRDDLIREIVAEQDEEEAP
eukprot:jgi/Pico_ML_1/51695/g266.t1